MTQPLDEFIAELRALLTPDRKQWMDKYGPDDFARLCTAPNITRLLDALKAEKAENVRLRDALEGVKWWAGQQCPDKPKEPCEVCGASEKPGGGACMAIENTLPEKLLSQIDAALNPPTEGQEDDR